MNSRTLSKCLTSISSALVLSAVAAFSHAQEIKIGFYPGAVMTIPSWIALAKGFYAAEGLDAKLIPAASGPVMSSNVASGAIDVGYNSPSNVGLTRERGFEQQIVLGNMLMPIVILARSDVSTPNLGNYPKSIADMKGLNWGSYGRGSDIENIMRVMARDAGLDPDKDVTWIGVGPPPTGLPAMQAKRIEVYGTTMPASEVAVSAGYGKILVDLRKGEGPADFRGAVYSVLLASAERVKKDPALFQKLVAAHKRTYCWLKDPKNFDEASQLIKSQMPVASMRDSEYLDLVRNAIALVTVKYPPAGLGVWNKVMVSGGILKETMPATVVWSQTPIEDPSCK